MLHKFSIFIYFRWKKVSTCKQYMTSSITGQLLNKSLICGFGVHVWLSDISCQVQPRWIWSSHVSWGRSTHLHWASGKFSRKFNSEITFENFRSSPPSHFLLWQLWSCWAFLRLLLNILVRLGGEGANFNLNNSIKF